MNFYKSPVVRFTAITLSAAALTSFLIFCLYNLQSRKENAGILSLEEDKISGLYGRGGEDYLLCSYPETASGSHIEWYENENHPKGKSLRLSFGHGQKDHFLGINFPLTLNLKPWLERGTLEFRVRGGENCSSVTELGVYLKEAPVMHRMASRSLAVTLDEQWQGLSFSFSDFFPVKEERLKVGDEGFMWEVEEMLFSINSPESDGAAELFIDNLKIISDGEVVYELF